MKRSELKQIIKEEVRKVLNEESSSNYKSTKDWPDGKYNGIISGYEVYSDDIDSGFKAITGVRGMNIPCTIHVKNGEAIVKDKNNGIITFSSEEAKQNYANSI